jgi:hypothetical protein
VHSHVHNHDRHPHTDLDASESGPDAILHAGALRTEKIAKFLEAHFGEVEVVETREIEVGGATDGEDTPMEDGDEAQATEDRKGDEKLLVFEPAIVVKLDDWEARIGLLDLVYIPAPLICLPTLYVLRLKILTASLTCVLVRLSVAIMNRSSNGSKPWWKWL